MPETVVEPVTRAADRHSPRVGLSASVALAIITIESIAAAFGVAGVLYVGWRDDGELLRPTVLAALALAIVAVVTWRAGRTLERLVSSSEPGEPDVVSHGSGLGTVDVLTCSACSVLHTVFAGWLAWFTVVDPVDAKSNMVVIAVALASLVTAVILALSVRAGRLPTDAEVGADARAIKDRIAEPHNGASHTSEIGRADTSDPGASV